MGRDELYITVPNLFRCPISLDVMKSPVSLCTGVTYDRSSIQHWLESGHDTCPATMQTLPTKDFVPNLTLHRLINHWAQSSTRCRPDSDGAPIITEQQVRVLIERIADESERTIRTDSLLKIVQFLSCCEENRRFFVSSGGFVDAVFDVLRRGNGEVEVMEMVIRVLDLILIEDGVKEKLNRLFFKSSNILSSIVLILQKGRFSSKIKAIGVLDSIAIDTESKRRISETENLLSILFQLLNSDSMNPTLTDTVLSCLVSITMTRSVKTQLVKFGIVEVLSKALINSRNKNTIHEKAMKLLSMVSGCSEGRLAISEDPKCVGAMVERLMKVSKTATEDGVVVLWSMCCVFGDNRVKEAVVKSNGVTKVLLVMQSEGEGSVRRMCRDLVKALRVGCNVELLVGSYHTKTTHIMPC